MFSIRLKVSNIKHKSQFNWNLLVFIELNDFCCCCCCYYVCEIRRQLIDKSKYFFNLCQMTKSNAAMWISKRNLDVWMLCMFLRSSEKCHFRRFPFVFDIQLFVSIFLLFFSGQFTIEKVNAVTCFLFHLFAIESVNLLA